MESRGQGADNTLISESCCLGQHETKQVANKMKNKGQDSGLGLLAGTKWREMKAVLGTALDTPKFFSVLPFTVATNLEPNLPCVAFFKNKIPERKFKQFLLRDTWNTINCTCKC